MQLYWCISHTSCWTKATAIEILLKKKKKRQSSQVPLQWAGQEAHEGQRHDRDSHSAGSILVLDLDGGYLASSRGENSSTGTLQICVLRSQKKVFAFNALMHYLISHFCPNPSSKSKSILPQGASINWAHHKKAHPPRPSARRVPSLTV